MVFSEKLPPVDATHQVFNQPPPLEDYNIYASDRALREALRREGGAWAETSIHEFGQLMGRKEAIALGELANRYPPELRTHDRYGNRIDEVEFHEAWHKLMSLGVHQQVHSYPWNQARPGAHVVRAALYMLLGQVEAGVLCPLTMTFAAVPALKQQAEIGEFWLPKLCSTTYDRHLRPAEQKAGCLMGMAMTEKQGCSDVRANTTKARPLGDKHGSGQTYLLTGHKWFCSAPMCDAFLTLAYTEQGLSCFLVPRFRPDGIRNAFRIQRLKDKLGNRSNASSEIEYIDTWAQMLGPEGRGVPTIIEMVHHTRLDCAFGSTAWMRQALTQAIHHAVHRSAFGKLLIHQPLMQNVLADLALESEAATALVMRLARTFDDVNSDASLRPFARIATAVSKYWLCKRASGMIGEALECLGGAGYVEESIMPRLYREAPLPSIWEGSGNVMCLDVLRAMAKEPESIPAFHQELALARGANKHYDHFLDKLEQSLREEEHRESRARRLVEMLALAMQASLLIMHAPNYVSDAFCVARLTENYGLQYGTLSPDVDFTKIIERASPSIA